MLFTIKLLQRTLVLSAICSLVFASCSSNAPVPPSETSSDSQGTGSSTSTSTSISKTDGIQQQSDGYAGWGANVGLPETKAKVANCNMQGKFWDRAANAGLGNCDPNQKVPFKCTEKSETITNTQMDPDQKDLLEQALVSTLQGYLFDQCVEQLDNYILSMVLPGPNNSLTIKIVTIARKK